MVIKYRTLLILFLCTITLSLTVSPTHAYWGNLVSKLFRLFDETPQAIGKGSALGKTIGGSSKTLRARLKAQGFMPDGDYAAHHVIPVELKEHRVLEKIGMDMDEVTNGIALPTKPSVHPTLPLHRGNHPSYTAAVARELDQIPDNLSFEETTRRVSVIQQMFREKLVAGAPLHPKYGAGDQWYK